MSARGAVRDLAFEARIDELLDAYKRRIARLMAVRDGDARTERYYVQPFKVSAYRIGGHWRTRIVTTKKGRK